MSYIFGKFTAGIGAIYLYKEAFILAKCVSRFVTFDLSCVHFYKCQATTEHLVTVMKVT
jgi:hypothetical protein